MPLIVGGDPHGRGVVATANYVARGFGIHSAMSAAEALRRCPHAVVRPPAPLALPRLLARGLVDGPRDRPDGRAGRDRRGLPRPRRGRAGLRRRARARRGGAGRRAGPHAPLVLARRRDARRWSPRSPPTGASRAGSPSSGPAARPRSSRPFPIRILPGVGPRAEERLVRARDRDDRRHRGARRRRAAARPAGQGRPRAARPRARHRPAAARGLDRADLDLAGGDVRARRRRPRAAARRAAPHVGEARRAPRGVAARSRAR